ncbi:imidazole glycerol phosphate synthase subunit HisH [Tabrizicola sp.]|uniref:imidazole glycerol phosphate synthase subunit HisH n=1 Tax=Tabrizicola sp. TaxID=2005166 RepID=UPI00262D482B|nr:imidazole glycerol phosphate synthase subunit HisH [Tabrizicola sp.]MDM7932032.1 imidazole glycerol phosphate synthase subunit HisH [Tabrizicola sp.]
MKVVVIDYGMGNLFSVRRALEVSGAADIEVTADPSRLELADRVVLPGVGAFVEGMAGLTAGGFVPAIHDYVASGKPLLGICLGMQMLMETSEEYGLTPGLGLIPGKVRAITRMRPDGTRRKLPSIGWAPLRPAGVHGWAGSVLADMQPNVPMYFLHSFHAEPEQAQHMLADYEYDGLPVTAAVRRGNVTGTQFHPEKSGPSGLAILRAFLEA